MKKFVIKYPGKSIEFIDGSADKGMGNFYNEPMFSGEAPEYKIDDKSGDIIPSDEYYSNGDGDGYGTDEGTGNGYDYF